MNPLEDPLLSGVAHGFGVRGFEGPAGLLQPRQVHGTVVVSAADCRGRREPPDADVIVCAESRQPVAVITADCVPILMTTSDGAAVAAIHAGWRGLAAGVVQAGVEALLRLADCSPGSIRAAIGPHIGPCCYEVDAPVLEPLQRLFGERFGLFRRAVPTRPGRDRIDLGGLVREALLDLGVPEDAVGQAAAACTRCDSERFHSYRRDGKRAGRLVHFIAARKPAVGSERRTDIQA